MTGSIWEEVADAVEDAINNAEGRPNPWHLEYAFKKADIGVYRQPDRPSDEVGDLDDTKRLNWLDNCSDRLNQRYGTNYGWTLILNHNVTRLMTDDWPMSVDLNDTEGSVRKHKSCRNAIDEQMARVSAALRQRSASTPRTGETK